ncbi:MAG: AAA family ATPase [Gemmatimonadaceae bacterium]
MRIRGWSIDGFGHFRDYQVSGISDGITVFHGPNEAGKSTLLAFFRGMLFGFPDRRSRESRYEPLRGGRHGGRLMLEVDGEPWTLERDLSARGGATVRVFTPRGEGTEDDLRRAVGSADSRLFRSVFAFSLTELQSFSTLSDDGARNRIFSAGIVGAGRAARHVITELGDQADALFKARGRTQVVPTLLKQLAERRQATAEARRAAQAYPELLHEEESCLAEKQRLDAAVAVARRAVRHFEGLISLWSIWRDLHEAEGQYSALDAIDAFPPDPERRLADVASKLEGARSRRADAAAECERAVARVAALRGETRGELAAIASDVAAHYETRDLYRSNVTRLQEGRLAAGHAADALGRALRSLGGTWNEGRLLAFDVSLPQRERIRAWSDRLRKAADDAQLTERDHTSLASALDQAERDVATAAGQLRAAPGPNPERVEALEGALRRLRARLADRRDREHAAAQQHAVWVDRARSLTLLESEADPEAEPGSEPGRAATPEADPEPGGGWESEPAIAAAPSAVTRFAPIAVALVGLLLAGALASVRPWLGVAGAVLAVAAGVGAAAWVREARATAERAAAAERRSAAARLAEIERAMASERLAASEHLAAAERLALARRRAYAKRREALATLVAEAQEAAERALCEVEDADALTAPDAAALGLGARPTAADLEDCDRALARQRQLAARAEQLQHGVRDAEARRDRIREQAGAAAARAAEARATLHAARREWGAWAHDAGLPGDMSPESALDFVPAVQQAREYQHDRDRLRTDADALEADVRRWEEHAMQLLVRAEVEGRGSSTAGSWLVEALHALHTQCVADRAARERLAAAEADLRAWRSKLDTASADLTRCEAAWTALLAEAGAEDEAHYRSRMQTFGERQRLRREIEGLRRQVAGRLGEGPEADAVRATLATGAVSEWERERERHEREAAALDEQLERAIRSHQDAQRRREALETSADIPKCEADEQALLTELNDTVERWRTLTLARALTEVTLREYVRTRQPAVVAHASRMFASVTDGEYTELRQDESGEGLSVVTRRGAVLGPEQLSRGTAEQLYLCLRLGLAAEFGSHGAQLPLVMDDVCVNFDPERARALASVVHDFAAGQQVIFFTCQPTTVDMLRAVEPELRVHQMPRYGPRVVSTEPLAATTEVGNR